MLRNPSLRTITLYKEGHQPGYSSLVVQPTMLTRDEFEAAYRALYRMKLREEGEERIADREYDECHKSHFEDDEKAITHFDVMVNSERGLINQGRLLERTLKEAGVEVVLDHDIRPSVLELQAA